jgi:hypothetical protein
MSDSPGLKHRTRKDGTRVPYWCAPATAIAAGWALKTVNLSDTPLEQISQRCQRLWLEMLDFLSSGDRPRGYDGTLGSLLDLYQRHPDSSFQKLKHSSRHPYEIYAHKLAAAYGARRVANITGLDLLRWHEAIRAPGTLAAATMAFYVLRAALSFGIICGFEDCAKLHFVMSKLRVPKPKPREFAPDASAIEAVRDAAHSIGHHRAAFCYALQFETTSRQWDLTGFWVPLSDPRASTIIDGSQKWIGPTWAAIDGGILTLTPSKTIRTTGKRTHVNLELCPMVMEELARITQESRSGPLIINEHTGRPYHPDAFAKLWRHVRQIAGLATGFWNRDIRAGGITEGGMAGASADDRAKLAGHSPRMTRSVYDRDVIFGANRVAEARAKFRDKNKP